MRCDGMGALWSGREGKGCDGVGYEGVWWEGVVRLCGIEKSMVGCCGKGVVG